ncbi:hypothetical protein [Verrucosispora sp. WMMD1129]|uniref:hypothetical protein n=1 Tax=Verrucosispora sp. WMMD1129 TaxID=3016093 RepID=UPI00249C86A3|nr:hypothetical protein [Verrucosispora sp. WMMD1129]WFE46296.1 hypothetical protein O7624_19060 [Verrucosispora sp. WMMD1129]
MAAAINRWVVRTVLVCTALAGLAAYHNHTTQPCGDKVGAGGMCVSTTWAGGAR